MLLRADYKRIVSAGFFVSSAFFLFVSLLSWYAYDHSFLYSDVGSHNQPLHNYAGAWGAQCAAALLYVCGSAAWLFIPLLLSMALHILGIISPQRNRSIIIGCACILIGQALLCFQMHCDWYNHISPGGLVGMYGTYAGYYWFQPYMFLMLTLCLQSMGILLIVRLAWVRPLIYGVKRALVATRLDQVGGHICAALCYPFTMCNQWYRRLVGSHIYKKYLESSSDCTENKFTQVVHELIFEDTFWQQYRGKLPSPIAQAAVADVNVSAHVDEPNWSAPSQEKAAEHISFIKPLDVLFKNVRTTEQCAEEEAFIKERARNLEAKLALFGITGQVVSITAGPVVTLFEYSPARDVKISKIVVLEDDLALALEAHSLRIIAPIPGRSVVGFEVANSSRQTVHFAEIAGSPLFKEYVGALPLIIGRDTTGQDVVVDLTEMPHLLVAGSTGSGKSVALNAMLTSLLCKVHPHEARLILIDPKRLEFAAFADIPHLIFPIITEVVRVPGVLQWAVKTMEERYAQLARSGVRHVSEYHKKYGVDAMPYIIIVIDELADLMMASKNGSVFGSSRSLDIEGLIARLAQMARAAGIHLIIATQRPSVDVITGLIKVNFPSRIACKVISKVDSRTILDHSGAEKLLGKGDMLFLNQKGMITRVHGAYVRDEEIVRVVEHVKSQQEVVYEELEISAAPCHSDDLVSDEDPLYSDVCAYVTTMSEISISLLQRKFRIGYNRSARLIDTLEARGIVLPADGGKFRKVASSSKQD